VTRSPIRAAYAAFALSLALSPLGAQTPQPAAPAPPAAPASSDDLEQRVRILERQLELAEERKVEKDKAAAVVTVGADGFVLASADGDFRLRLGALVQEDGRFFLADDRQLVSDTFVLRRARPILEGTLWKIVGFRLMPDFGTGSSSLQDAWLELRFSSALRLRAGKGKVPVGLEALLEDKDLPFVERGLPSNLAPVRDVGLQLGGEPFGGRVVYALGVFNGVPDAASGDGDNGDDKDVAARLVWRPFQRPAGEAPPAVGLALGLGASLGRQHGSASAPNLPVYRSPSLQTVFGYRADGTAPGSAVADGRRLRLAPQGWFYTGPFLVFAEWTESRQEVRRAELGTELSHRAWQVAGTWAITGERVTERGMVPRRPFVRGGAGWGGLLLSLRYGELTLDAAAFPGFADPDRSARRAVDAGASLGWLLDRNFKLVLDYQQTAFDGGAAGGRDRPTERAVLVRAQVAF
jgi:phosphate-selective porin OprO/OprP